jgi:Right handed beta helix region
MRSLFRCWVALVTLFCVNDCAAAISANTAWEIRASVGADTSGGGFVTGATGTDRSQSNTPFCNSADLATTGTAATSAACPFSATSVGNTIQITAGGCTAGFYQVISVAVATATLDRSAGTSTNCTFALGGALATISKALGVMVISNIIFVKATATYVITANLVLAVGQAPTATNPPTQLVGYTTTRTDAGRATIQLSTNTGLDAIHGSAIGWFISNFVLDCNSLGTSQGLSLLANSVARNLQVKNCTTNGVTIIQSQSMLIDSELTANSGNAAVNIGSSMEFIERNYIHDNTTTGIVVGSTGAVIEFNVIANNSGASTDGIQGNASMVVNNNTIYNNGRDGLNFGSQDVGQSTVRNNLFVQNGRFGLQGHSSAGWASFPQFDGNAYFSNTSANRSNANDTGSVNPINAANPYTTSIDVILTAGPFTNTATHDFTLNSTAGGGAAARGAATPGALPGLAQSGAMSFGALQPAAGAGSSVNVAAFVQ